MVSALRSQLALSALLLTVIVFAGSLGQAQTCESVFASARSLSRVIHEGARIENLAVGVVTAEEMKSFEADLAESAVAVAEKLKTVSGAKDIKTVLYVAAGFDAATGFRVFENAQTVIGTDNHPFTLENSPGFASSRDHTGWVHFSDVDKLQSVSAGVVRSILSLSPSIRILKFQALHFEGRTGNYPTTHGIVEFDTGPRTLRRRYIHIHAAKDTPRESSLPWIASLLDGGFDAILVKGAQRAYFPYEKKLAPLFVERLREQQGILVDGDGAITQWPWKDNPVMMRDKNLHVRNTHISGMGYDEVHILKFGD